jgi:hypothetical protein
MIERPIRPPETQRRDYYSTTTPFQTLKIIT